MNQKLRALLVSNVTGWIIGEMGLAIRARASKDNANPSNWITRNGRVER